VTTASRSSVTTSQSISSNHALKQNNKSTVYNTGTGSSNPKSNNINSKKFDPKSKPLSSIINNSILNKNKNTPAIPRKKSVLMDTTPPVKKLNKNLNTSTTSLNRSTISNSSKNRDFSLSKKSSVGNKKGFMLCNNGSISPLIKRKSTMNYTNNIIEEYDYNKILLELKCIFGNDFEDYDENSKNLKFNFLLVLFSNLDDTSTKGLIKGLIMLSASQDRKLRQTEDKQNQIKKQFSQELYEKDLEILKLQTELDNLKNSLKGRK
jgi:hypothetical protein